MTYKRAKIFSSGTEYEVFRYNYCDNHCAYHKEMENGFPEVLENGGCPIEDELEFARLDSSYFPTVLLEVWEEGKCLNYHHCPFYLDWSEEE